MRRALVIGGSGFIGLNLVDRLLERGVSVRATRRKRSVTAFLRKRPVELVHACLGDVDSLVRAMTDCDVVFVAGAHYPRYSTDLRASLTMGITGVRSACVAAMRARVSRLVFTSSVATLDAGPEVAVLDEDHVPAVMPEDSVYRATKWAMERTVDAAARAGLDVVTLLPGGCIGPWDVRVGTGAVLVATLRGEIPFWVDGLVHLVDVGDVAEAHVRAAERGEPGARYAVPGTSVRMKELLRIIATRYGAAPPPNQLSADLARQRADQEEREAEPFRGRVGFPREMVDIIVWGRPVSSARARRDLALPFTPLPNALDRAHAWFERFGYLHPKEPALTRRIHG